MLRRPLRRAHTRLPATARAALRSHLLLRFAALPMAAVTTSPHTQQAEIRLELVGEPRLCLPDATHVLERKDAALLALLAIDGPTPRARAAALLWPEVDEEAARNNLRQRLHRLRRRVGRDPAETHNDVLRLAADVEHDLAGLPQRLTADGAAGRGELLGTLDYADCPEFAEWIGIAREQWRSTRRNALAEIASRLESEGHIALALQYAERLVADDPLLEHAHRRLMRLHYLRGDRAAALAVYARCCELLQLQLRARPAKETLELARLVEASGVLPAPSPAPRPVAVLRPPRLVGRDTEWRLLEAVWAQQRIALVTGEPGIGKTRLLGDFAASRAHSGSAVVLTGARPGDTRMPYATLARLLRAVHSQLPLPANDASRVDELARLLPELGLTPSAKLEPVRLSQALAWALACWHGAGLAALVIDDLHFADEASLDALLTSMAGERARSIVWLFGVRLNEQPPRLAEWRTQLDADALSDIRLTVLDVAAIAALLDSLALPGIDAQAWAEPLARHTGGNPMFVLETLSAVLTEGRPAQMGHTLRLPAPGNVGQLIERRLTQLSPPALKLARVAALAGQDFSVELAAHVLQSHPLDLAEAWRELEAAQVIRDNAFAHDLIFEATQRSVPAAIAQLLHRQIAGYLETQAAPPGRVAQHWHAAHEWARAGAAAVRAADQALAASRREDEAASLALAVDCFERSGDSAAQFGALDRAFAAALHVEDMNRVAALVAAMLRLARSDRQRAQARIAEATEANVLYRPAEAEQAARQALACADRAGDAALQVRARQQLASALARRGRAEEGIALIEPLLPTIEQTVDAAAQRAVFSDYAFLLEYADRRREAIELRDRILALASAAEDWSLAHETLTDQALSIYYLGRLEDSTALYEQARRLRDRLGAGRGWSLMDDMALAGHLRELGRYAESLRLTEEALPAMRRGGFEHWATNTENDLAVTFLLLGQTQRAMRLLTELPADAPAFLLAGRYAARARLERMRGNSARALLEKVLACVVPEGGRAYVRLKIDIELCREIEPAAGAERLQSLIDEAQRRQYHALVWMAMLYRADCLRRCQRATEAAALAREVTPAYADRAPVVIYAGDFWWLAYQALDAGGDKPGADAALQRGARWIDTALTHVPDEFRESFVNRNGVNRALLAVARRRLLS